MLRYRSRDCTWPGVYDTDEGRICGTDSSGRGSQRRHHGCGPGRSDRLGAIRWRTSRSSKVSQRDPRFEVVGTEPSTLSRGHGFCPHYPPRPATTPHGRIVTPSDFRTLKIHVLETPVSSATASADKPDGTNARSVRVTRRRPGGADLRPGQFIAGRTDQASSSLAARSVGTARVTGVLGKAEARGYHDVPPLTTARASQRRFSISDRATPCS